MGLERRTGVNTRKGQRGKGGGELPRWQQPAAEKRTRGEGTSGWAIIEAGTFGARGQVSIISIRVPTHSQGLPGRPPPCAPAPASRGAEGQEADVQVRRELAILTGGLT